ncbi:MAG TPA: hypothetical protein VE091_13425 [Gemmatimonadales bacterium]|nr:hypothetical protein [Gemmatimonadales bacterium]
MIIQGSGTLGDHSIEAPDLGNLIGQHSLTLVNYSWPGKTGEVPGPASAPPRHRLAIEYGTPNRSMPPESAEKETECQPHAAY